MINFQNLPWLSLYSMNSNNILLIPLNYGEIAYPTSTSLIYKKTVGRYSKFNIFVEIGSDGGQADYSIRIFANGGRLWRILGLFFQIIILLVINLLFRSMQTDNKICNWFRTRAVVSYGFFITKKLQITHSQSSISTDLRSIHLSSPKYLQFAYNPIPRYIDLVIAIVGSSQVLSSLQLCQLSEYPLC